MSNPDGSFYGPDYNVLKVVSSKTGIDYKFQKGRSFTGMIQEVNVGHMTV